MKFLAIICALTACSYSCTSKKETAVATALRQHLQTQGCTLISYQILSDNTNTLESDVTVFGEGICNGALKDFEVTFKCRKTGDDLWFCTPRK